MALPRSSTETQAFGALRPVALSLGENARAASVAALNQALADAIALRDLYKKHHWQVAGSTFHQLHLLFDRHQAQQAELIDDLAERVMALGGVAIAASWDVAETTRLPRPPKGREAPTDQLHRLLAAHEAVLAHAHASAAEAAANGDDGTNDLFVSQGDPHQRGAELDDRRAPRRRGRCAVTQSDRDPVDDAQDGSFPASVSPSWTLGRELSPVLGNGVREVVGVFPDADSFGRVVAALQSSGVDRARLSVLAGRGAAETQLRSSGFHRVDDLLDRPDAPRAALVEPESVSVAQGAAISGLFYVGAALGAGVAFASGAVAAAPIIAAALGSGAAGGALGGILAHRLGAGRARYAEAQLAHGGLVLWARVVTPDEEARAIALMRQNGGREVHAHGVPDRTTTEGA